MKELAYVNGVVSRVEEAVVSIDDRGLQFGDGVYEVLRTYDGRLWALERHLRRLERSLCELWIEGVAVEEVRAVVERLNVESGILDALVYIQVTRGVSARDYAWPRGIQPTFLATVRFLPPKEPANRERGVSAITYPEIRWGRVDIKSLNLLANMMAKKAAQEAGAYEALFVTREGTMTEGASTSLFLVQDDVLVTREKGPHILPGVTRELVLECASEGGIAVEERAFRLDELRSSDEVLLTGTTFGVYSVVEVDKRPIGGGTPGPVGEELLRRYMERVAEGRDAP
jgi:D-alanine transaminase